MARPSHPKLRMARRMLTRAERAAGVSPFSSQAWMARSDAIRARLGIGYPILIPKESAPIPSMRLPAREQLQKKPGFFQRLFSSRNFS